MTDTTTPVASKVWPKAPRADGMAVWGWQVMRNGYVIGVGECASENAAQRAMAAATKNHGRSLADTL